VPWTVPWPEYRPAYFVHDSVLDNDRLMDPARAQQLRAARRGGFGWADPEEVALVKGRWGEQQEQGVKQAVSFTGTVRFDADGYPLNPYGRTGLRGRGLLGKWGANQAADPIVTRFHPQTSQMQMVAIKRKDTGEWGIPGGMVDDGELVSATVKREFKEEAGNVAPEERAGFDEMIDVLFGSGRVVYRGYVDDPRNTDNAWIETTAFHFHCSKELGERLPLMAGDDAAKCIWLDIGEHDKRYTKLYASHKQMVNKAASELLERTAQQSIRSVSVSQQSSRAAASKDESSPR